ncbi:MAG: outer membrane beta-barrel domain-containing protein [Polyangiaceae bacterium]|jgi:outer membrane beta-barrel protein|nr:outer membrane beta-barrel domain-containing protein [Polyangiaceae bacterium]
MKQARVGLLVATALLAWPLSAQAQQRGKPKKPPKAAPAAAAPAVEAAPEPAPAAAAPEAPVAPTPEPPPEEAKGICEEQPELCPKIDLDRAAAREVPAPMYAVQQIYALRARRLEINPYWSFTLNDQFVSHNGPGLSLNYYLTNVFAVGANFNLYSGLNQASDFNSQARRAARVAVPLTEYDWSAGLNFTYVPVYGKFAGFSDFIFHYDLYVVGGVGLLSNRPIAVIDPDNRTFDSKARLTIVNPGIGLRVFFNRWFAATMEVRDYIFLDQLENTEVQVDALQAANKDNWYGETKLTNHVQAQLGVSVFFPFSWHYRLPK